MRVWRPGVTVGPERLIRSHEEGEHKKPTDADVSRSSDFLTESNLNTPKS